MNKFEEYNASVLSKQGTLLKKFEYLIKYLKENPSINIFYCTENYSSTTVQKSNIKSNGKEIEIGDCLIFANCYYSFVKTIGTDEITVETGISFKGEQGIQGESISGVHLNSSNHLIVSLSNGQTIDAGLIDLNIAGDIQVENIDAQGEGKGIIIANKISQRIPNWEIDLKSILNTSFFKDTSTLYAKLCLLGNELELVISGKFIAKADANAYHVLIANQFINIPNEIAEKIFRAEGTSLKVDKTGSGSYNEYITAFRYVRSNPAIGDGNVLLQSQLAKNISLNVYNFGATTEDAECFIDLRVQLTII